MRKEEQVCRVINGFMICNCIMRNGVCVPTKSGKNYKFPVRKGWKRRKRFKKPTVEEGVTKTATTSKK